MARKVKIKKRRTARRKIEQSKEIGGGLILVLIVFALSFLTAVSLLTQKIVAILLLNAKIGVYISAILLLFYTAFLFYSIVLVLLRKAKAVKISFLALYLGLVFTLWYWLIGPLIFYQQNLFLFMSNFVNLVINLAIIIAIILYLRKSKRVKDTFVK